MDNPLDMAGNTAGKVLIANDVLNAPPFGETLVFMAEHDHEGAMGFIVNRPTDRRLSDLIPNSPPGLEAIPVYFGGPVQSNSLLIACFKQGDTPQQISLTCEKDLEKLPLLVKQAKTWVRAYMGYSGWSSGQLEAEILTDAWKIGPPHSALFNEAWATGLWNAYQSEDRRWHQLLSYLPDDARRN